MKFNHSGKLYYAAETNPKPNAPNDIGLPLHSGTVYCLDFSYMFLKKNNGKFQTQQPIVVTQTVPGRDESYDDILNLSQDDRYIALGKMKCQRGSEPDENELDDVTVFDLFASPAIAVHSFPLNNDEYPWLPHDPEYYKYFFEHAMAGT